MSQTGRDKQTQTEGHPADIERPLATVGSRRCLVVRQVHPETHAGCSGSYFRANHASFLRRTELEGVDVVTVLNGNGDVPADLRAVRTMRRPNQGKDFGAWSFALFQCRGYLLDYRYVFLVNETVAGPFVAGDWLAPFTARLEDDVDVAMVGISQSEEMAFHVQSMALCFRSSDAREMLDWDMWWPSYLHDAAQGGRRRMVRRCEVELTQRWVRRGRTVAALSPLPPGRRAANPWLRCAGLNPATCVFVKHTPDFHTFPVAADGTLE